MKRILGFWAGIPIMVALSVHAWAFEGEPDGFRGIPWGAPFTSYASQMVQSENDGRTIFYHRPGDKLSLGAAQLREVSYIFYDGQFEGVLINSEAGSTLDMMATFRAQFGPGMRPNRFMDHFFWEGQTAIVNLNCSDVTDDCQAALQSTTVHARQEADKAAAAAGARKDF